jgi:flavin reductase (DIM6/NTAB) family NADH-FMN oxidoreductase RutF
MTFEATGDEINPGGFWRALGSRPLGATIVTAQADDRPAGFLALSFAHVSAAPPTVLVSVGRSTSALPDMLSAGSFAANVLPAGSLELARAFGGETAAEERFAVGAWERFVTGAPVLKGAAGVFDCRLTRTIEEEGAVIVIGRVVGLRTPAAGTATLAFMGGFREI